MHAAHSPFLFDFLEKVYKEDNSKNELSSLYLIKKKLFLNNDKIDVYDFGTGKKSSDFYSSTISKQAKRSLKNESELKTLYKITKWVKPKNILELGTSFGISSLAMLMAYPECKIISMEGCPNTAKIAQKNLDESNIENINIVVGNINQTLSEVLSYSKPIDLVFMDANHTYDDTLKYFFQIKSLLNKNSLIIFDDIHWSKGIYMAWKNIINDTEISLSVETWNFGFAFFNPDLSKQHFVIRK